jgi:hypothetical protein
MSFLVWSRQMEPEIKRFKEGLERSWAGQESEYHEKMSAWLNESNAVRILQNANDNLKRNVELLQDESSVLRQCLADQRDLLGEAYYALQQTSDALRCTTTDLQQTSDDLRRARIAAIVCFIVAIVATAYRAF